MSCGALIERSHFFHRLASLLDFYAFIDLYFHTCVLTEADEYSQLSHVRHAFRYF